MEKFFIYIQLPNFDVASNAADTFKVYFMPLDIERVKICDICRNVLLNELLWKYNYETIACVQQDAVQNICLKTVLFSAIPCRSSWQGTSPQLQNFLQKIMLGYVISRECTFLLLCMVCYIAFDSPFLKYISLLNPLFSSFLWNSTQSCWNQEITWPEEMLSRYRIPCLNN